MTTVLSPFQDFSRVRPDVLEAACERGSKVHAAAAAYALEVWSPALPEELQGYFTSFTTWFDAYVDEVVLVEPEWIDEELGYGGHPDLLCRMRGDSFLSLPDLKTPLAGQKSWGPQCSAYRRLGIKKGYDVRRNFSVRLRPNGAPALVTEYSGNYEFDLGIFLNALAVFKYFNG